MDTKGGRESAGLRVGAHLRGLLGNSFGYLIGAEALAKTAERIVALE